MKCQKCNKIIDEDSNFCKYCGAKVIQANVCPKCGAKHLPKDAKFCPDCGAPLTTKDELDFNVCAFVKSSVMPFWPKAGSGTSLSENNKYNLNNALKVISSKANDSSMSELNKMRLTFVEQSLKAILDISNGCTPYFRGIIQSCPAYSAFWESLRDECGENNYNKYWHYNSGTFADRLIDKMQSL